MAADGTHDNQQPDVQKAVQAGTDLSQGSDKAFNALQSEVDAARVKYGEGTPGFNQFGHEVARGLKQGGTLEEMSEQWAKHNIDKVALSDQKHVKPDDLNPTFGHDALEKAYLKSLHKNYGDLQHRAGDTAFGNLRNQFSAKDFGHVINTRQHERDQADQVRMAQDQAGREQAKSARVMGDLFKNDGNHQHSLYGVLDSIKSGKSDGKISKGDLGRYQQEYAERAGHVPPDFGFTPENLDAVRTLDREWNGPLGVSLRGTSPRVGSPKQMGEQAQTSSYINLDVAAQLNGKSVDQLFASYSPQGLAQPGLRQTMGNAAGSGPDVTGSQPIPNSDANAQYDAGGNLISPTGNANLAQANPGDGSPNPIVRPVGPNGIPVPQGDRSAQPAPKPGPGPNADGSAYGDYDFGNRTGAPAGAPAGARPAAGDGAQPVLAPKTADGGVVDASGRTLYRRPQAGDTGAAQPPAQPQGQPGADNGAAQPPAPAQRQPGADNATAAAPARARAGAVPDIDSAPALPPLPDIKPGDDPAKIAGDFQKAAIAHFAADAVYTVKPGQGWDRVARDTMRKTGEDISNEGKVEQLSDQIAKLNGLSGRLDKSHVLQPGQQVRVRDDAWIKTQVESAMGALAKKVTDAATPGTATAPANTETPDLFSPSRSGEGDVTNPNATAPAAKPDATVPVPATKGDATAAQPATTTASGQPVNPLESSAPPAIPTSTDGTPLPAAAVVGSTNPGDGSVAAATTPGAPPVNADVAAAQATQAQLDAAAAAKQKADQATPAPAATVADSDGLPSPYGNPFDKT